SLLPLFETCRLRDILFFSFSVDAAAAVGGTISPHPHFMVEYLVNTCGFSSSEAAKFSKPLAHLRSTEKPDAVVNFMRSQGFDGAGIRKVISLRPIYLCCNVEKNLAPKFQFLRDLGLSESDIVDAIVSNHGILGLDVHRSIVPKLEMWESLLGSRELVLMHLKKTGWFFCSSVEKTLLPNLKFLRDECGIPEERVSLVLRSCPQFISQKPESLRSLVARADELGVPRQSRMFVRTLVALQMKRVIPRFRVTEMLKLKGLWTGQAKFSYILSITDTKFIEQFVLPHKENVPELLDILRAGASMEFARSGLP
ncbi:mTERF family protein, partial [Musa troglodytarum]